MHTRLSVQVPVIAVAALTVGCSAARISLPRQSAHAPQKVTLTISAAASLQTVLSELEPAFEAAHPDIDIFYNWGGSGTLQRQIEQGAPADIFFSASSEQMDAIERQGKLRSSRSKSEAATPMLSNQLVLVAPVDSSLTKIEDLAQLSASQRVAVGDFISVPAGQYAQATLAHFELLPELTSQLVFFNNVRGVLAAVESGHAAAGFVYYTDAQLSDRVKIVAIAPANSHPPIRYPIATLQRSAHPEAAQSYIDFLTSPVTTEAFRRHGFIPQDHR